MEASASLEYPVDLRGQILDQFSLRLVEEVLAKVGDLAANEAGLPVVQQRIVESIIEVDRHF